MKNFRFLIVLLASLLLLVGCNSLTIIRGDFEKAGYEYSEEAAQYVEELMAEFEDKKINVRPHLFSKGLNYAIVLEFNSVKEMEEELEKSETLKGLVKDLQKSDFVRGNCILIPFAIAFDYEERIQEMIDIFQGRK
ncbi:MAG: hypothetical protein WBK54_05745 [Bacilli bacterium]|jgi:hypothetical protein|nr:hypothetical protein [Acholeplasmataceae bacterium]